MIPAVFGQMADFRESQWDGNEMRKRVVFTHVMHHRQIRSRSYVPYLTKDCHKHTGRTGQKTPPTHAASAWCRRRRPDAAQKAAATERGCGALIGYTYQDPPCCSTSSPYFLLRPAAAEAIKTCIIRVGDHTMDLTPLTSTQFPLEYQSPDGRHTYRATLCGAAPVQGDACKVSQSVF